MGSLAADLAAIGYNHDGDAGQFTTFRRNDEAGQGAAGVPGVPAKNVKLTALHISDSARSSMVRSVVKDPFVTDQLGNVTIVRHVEMQVEDWAEFLTDDRLDQLRQQLAAGMCYVSFVFRPIAGQCACCCCHGMRACLSGLDDVHFYMQGKGADLVLGVATVQRRWRISRVSAGNNMEAVIDLRSPV